MNTLLQDLRYTTRMLLRCPGFAVVAIVTLAVAIGANTAIFSVISAVLLRPLPYPDSDDLVVVWSQFPARDVYEETLAPGMYFELENQTQVFDQVAIARSHSFTLTGVGPPERIRGMRASASCLSMLGAKPELGRIFVTSDDGPSASPAIVLSHPLWQRRFGGDPGVIGRTIQLDEQAYTVVGVLKRGFPVTRAYLSMLHDPDARVDYWIPLALTAADREDHSRQNYQVLARLKPGVDLADAQAAIDVLASRMKQEFPANYPPDSGFAMNAVPLLGPMVREVQPALRLLGGAAVLVLLIACANVANLLLARATGRNQEIAMRMALGASRSRIVRQLLTESVILALMGGIVGLLVAWWGTSALLKIGTSTIPRLGEVAIDARVVAFAFGLSLLTGIVFGLAPAWTASKASLNQTLRDGRGNTIGVGLRGPGRFAPRRLLVVGEISLSAVLLIGAGLLMHSFYRLQNVDPGFSPQGVLSFQLPRNPDYGRNMDAYGGFYADLRQRLAGLPGVEAVGGMSVLPLTPGESFAPVLVEGYTPPSGQAELQANSCTALWDCFETMGIPLIAGRYFDERDTADSLPVAIVDEAFARRVWPNDDPIGKRIRDAGLGQLPPWLTVVGVVGTVRRSGLEGDSRITYYQPYSQWASKSMYVVVRTSSDPSALTSAIAGQVWALDADWPILDVATMEQRVSAALAERRFSLFLLGGCAASALVLATVGLYAVLAHMVSQGTHEIGIRMALGARRSDVLRRVLSCGLTLTGIGLLIGLVISLAGTRILASLLYEVRATDPATFVGVPLLLLCVALVACYFPARRAADVDPMVALRCE